VSLPDLTGRTAVVTGASRGIGAHMARDFAARGMRLGLCSRGAPVLADDGQRVVASQLDVRDAAAVDEFTRAVEARLGRIDVWRRSAAPRSTSGTTIYRSTWPARFMARAPTSITCAGWRQAGSAAC
jgi:NAD(P)-dependent dehydrogenase (short-subunit alcohol dehydrogenase family)